MTFQLFNQKFSLKSLFIIALGNLLFALTVNIFLVSNQMGQGGVTGLSILAFYTWKIPVEWTYFILNAVLFIIGYRFLDSSRLLYTIYSFSIFPLFIRLTNGWHYTFQDTMLIPITAGVLIGISIGLIMLAGGSSAGLDIIAFMLNRYFHVPISMGVFILDLLIILPSGFIIGFEKVIYTLIMLAISTRVIDYMLEGLNMKKKVIVISQRYEEIGKVITEQVSRGVTILDAKGYYTKNQRTMLYIIIDRSQLVKVMKLINEVDPLAFTTISDVHKVSGEGFTFTREHTSNEHSAA